MRSDEFVILRLPSNSENIVFIYQIFGITQYIFYDDRFPTKRIKEENPDKFNKSYYDSFREKCLEINNSEVSFTVNEFVFLSKLIDFVSKCLIGEPNSKLSEIIQSDFKNEKDFDYDKYREMYLFTATRFFEGFRLNCKNEALLKKISDELNWSIDI